MCPSYRVTRDRLHSPKGRAAAMRKWLRQLAQAGHDPLREPDAEPRSLWLAAARDAIRGRSRDGSDDFSHQVWTAMDGCLSCRACATQCPVKVDVPSFKSRFLDLYHRRYPRPLGDYAFAALEPASRIFARVPRFANAMATSRVGRAALARFAGISDAPAYSRPSLYKFLRQYPVYRFSHGRFRNLATEQQARTVLLVQDAFTSFFDTEVLIAVVHLLSRLGYQPLVLPFKTNGKALQVKGFLPEFRRTAASTAAFLQQVATLGRPLIGIEPSATLTYREEYPSVLGRDALPEIHLLEEWLAATLSGDEETSTCSSPARTHLLLQHCTAATSCPQSALAWQRTFAHFGLSLEQAAVGCCGMSGAYGHESRHQPESRGIYDLSWADALQTAGATPVVPGYSCRTQIRRFNGSQPAHPARILLDHIDCGSTQGRPA